MHAQDIHQPLGLVRTPSVDALTPVADFFARRDFTVASRTHVADLQLRADDGPFATGTGPLVTGSTLALVMSMAGRVSYVAELDGPGVSALRSRLKAEGGRKCQLDRAFRGGAAYRGRAAYRNRTDDLRVTSGPRPGSACATSTDSTDNRTDGTRCAGIIRQTVARAVPRAVCRRSTTYYCA